MNTSSPHPEIPPCSLEDYMVDELLEHGFIAYIGSIGKSEIEKELSRLRSWQIKMIPLEKQAELLYEKVGNDVSDILKVKIQCHELIEMIRGDIEYFLYMRSSGTKENGSFYVTAKGLHFMEDHHLFNDIIFTIPGPDIIAALRAIPQTKLPPGYREAMTEKNIGTPTMSQS